jgi:hypothetical protein
VIGDVAHASRVARATLGAAAARVEATEAHY